MNDLKKIHQAITDRLHRLEFSRLWPSFHLFPFALYNDKFVEFGSQTIPFSTTFVGNTAIKWQESWLAIWDVKTSLIEEIDLLTAKIVHEMFHAYQFEQQEGRFPNEFQGMNYGYSDHNLSIKYQENLLLTKLIESFSSEKWQEFLEIRTSRKKLFPNQVEYENKVEVVEGMAQYIEMLVLRHLNYALFEKQWQSLLERLFNKFNLLNIRHHSYDVGSIILFIIMQNNIEVKHTIGKENQTIFDQISANVDPKNIVFKPNPEITILIKEHLEKRQQTMHSLIQNNQKQEGSFSIRGFDPLNAFIIDDFMYNPNFLMIEKNGENELIKGPVVCELSGEFKGAALWISKPTSLNN